MNKSKSVPMISVNDDKHKMLRVKSAIDGVTIRKIVDDALHQYFDNNPVPILESKSA